MFDPGMGAPECRACLTRRHLGGKGSLHLAAVEGDVGAVRRLLAARASPDKGLAALGGHTPLYMAVEAQKHDVVRTLLAGAADVNAAKDNGATPLWRAAQDGSVGMLRVLLEARAGVDAPTERGRTPLLIAAEKRQFPAMVLLLAAGADPVRADNDGDTPMDALGLEPHELAELTSDPVTFAVLDRLRLGERYDPAEEDTGAEKGEADREDGLLAQLMAI